ncbi:MAG TPA: outer membrane lipoprotein-sorting protein [Longimicrobiaceae bacterium]
MNRYVDFVIGRPRTILVAILLATLYFAAGVARLETRNNQESELPASDPIVRTNERLAAVFGEKAVVLVGIQAEDVFTAGTLRKVAAISEALRQVEGVIDDEVLSLATVNDIRGVEWGLEVGPLLDGIPVSAADLTELRESVRTNDLLNGQLVSADGTLTLIQANVEEGYDQETVHREVGEIIAAHQGPERLYLAGDAIQAQEIDHGIEQDVSRLLPLVLLLVLVGFYLSFRSWRGVWFPFSITLLSVTWTMGLMGHLGIPVTVVSSALPILMVAIASSYGIHVLHRYYEASAEHLSSGARVGLTRVIPPILLAGVTSALGSASLITFRVTSIREFGIMTALGVLATIVLSLTYAPALLTLLRPRAGHAAESHWMDRLLVPLSRLTVRRPRAILVGTAAVFAVAAVGISRVEIGTDFVKYFPGSHPLRQSFDVFDAGLGGARRMEIMIEGSGPDAIKDPALLRSMLELQEYAAGLEGVGRTRSFADVIARIHQEMNGGDPAFHAIPESSELIAQYLLLYSMSADAGDFGTLVDYDYQRAKVQVMLTTSEQRDHRRLYEAFQRFAEERMGPGVRMEFGGEVMFWLAQIHHIAVGKVFNILTALGIVLLFCSLVFRSLSAGLFTIVPLVVSTVLTFGVMGFLGIRLETGTAIITSIAVGIGVDFALHYLVYLREELRSVTGEVELEEVSRRVFLTAGRAICFDVMSNILGFSVLALSGFTPIRYFAWLVSLTMLTVGLGTLLLMPAILALWRPAFLFGGARRLAIAAPEPATPMLTTTRAVVSSFLGVALLAGATGVSAQTLTGREIIERNDAMLAVSDETVDFTMKLINKRGQGRERQISWVRRSESGRESALIRFAAPADVRGTALLSVEAAGGETDQWLYLPALQRSRRISASNQSDSFVGSDFAFEDLRPEELDDFSYRLLREEAVDGAAVYVVEAVPATADRKQESGYARREIRVRKDNFVVVRVNFYDRRGELLKEFRASDVRPVEGSKSWRAHTMEMRNVKTGHATVLTFGEFVIDSGVSGETFSLRRLERGS